MKTIRAKRKSIESMKPFKLVKYVSLSSLIVTLVCTFLLSGFISQRAKAILFQKSEQYASIVAENLNHQVFFQFTLPTLITDGEIRLSRQSQYERLDRVVRNTIHGFAVERVNIYDPEQVLTYSTDAEKIGTKGNLGEVFKRALREESVSLLSTEGRGFSALPWKTGPQKLKTYLPMWEEQPMSWKRGKVLGVFEISQDVTGDYEIIHGFQWIVGTSFLAFVGILFTMIALITVRAERIIGMRTSERLKLEEQLDQAERLAALGEMIAGVSHEIRNPLGIIRSTAELLYSRAEGDRQRRLSSIIVEEATRLNDILTEFLDFARPRRLHPSKCRIEDVIDRNLHVMEHEFQRLGIRVEKNYQTGDYTMEADSDMLYRALVNLLANALQAMSDGGGTLRVRTGLVNGKEGPPLIELHIGDTGQGIPPEVRKKIFNPFFTTREKGTGLGLAIVQSIIDSHNGDIEVVSEEGAGTTMIVRLPLTQPEPDAGDEAAVDLA